MEESFGPVQQADGGAKEICASAKAFSPGPLWVVGGADLATQFLGAGLLTRIDLFVIPVLIGEGFPAFASKSREKLELAGSQTYPTGIVRLSYCPSAGPPK
jgi:dihydrofolate reductase